MGRGAFEVGAGRRKRATLDIGERRRIGGDEAELRPHLDRQIAQRQTRFDVHAFDGAAAVLDRVIGTRGGAEARDRMQDQILGRDAEGEFAVDAQAHCLGLALHERLRREHVRHFRRANPEGQRPKAPVRAGMGVTTDDRRAGQREPEFGTDDVHDALVAGAWREVDDAVRGAACLQAAAKRRAGRVRVNRATRCTRQHVIGGRKGQRRI